MKSGTRFQTIRGLVLGGAAVALMAGAVLHQPLTHSSPVQERTLRTGTVTAILDAGESRYRRQGSYIYLVESDQDGQLVQVRTRTVLSVGQRVTIERLVRQNGTVDHQLAAAEP